jgi:hypothetical protein
VPVHTALSSQITSLARTKTNPGATLEQMVLIRNSHAYRQKIHMYQISEKTPQKHFE